MRSACLLTLFLLNAAEYAEATLSLYPKQGFIASPSIKLISAMCLVSLTIFLWIFYRIIEIRNKIGKLLQSNFCVSNNMITGDSILDWLYFAVFTELSMVILKIVKAVKMSDVLYASHFYSILFQLTIICFSALGFIDIITISKPVREFIFFPE